MTMEHADQISAVLASFDTLDSDQAKFMEEVSGAGGATWAIERFGGQMFFARQMARIVRPLLERYETTESDEWVKLVKNTRREIVDRLINNYGRCNPTSTLQNAINQWEAEAMSKFVTMIDYWLQG